jgi:hypothetical protein
LLAGVGMEKKNIINELSESEAKNILRILAEEDIKTARRIEALAEELFADVDIWGIGEDVFYDLDRLDVHELWDNSGKTRYGYVDPGDEAYDMVKRVLDDYIDEYDRYIRLNKRRLAMEYMIEIISGLMEFDINGSSEFRDWAEDIADSCIEEYKDKFKNDEGNSELVDEFMQRIDDLSAEGQDI